MKGRTSKLDVGMLTNFISISFYLNTLFIQAELFGGSGCLQNSLTTRASTLCLRPEGVDRLVIQVSTYFCLHYNTCLISYSYTYLFFIYIHSLHIYIYIHTYGICIYIYIPYSTQSQALLHMLSSPSWVGSTSSARVASTLQVILLILFGQPCYSSGL